MASIVEYDALQTEFRDAKTTPSGDKLLKFLRLVRELRISNNASVAHYGVQVLTRHKRLVNEEEYWLLHEQVAVACMCANALPQASKLLNTLQKKFPKSMRVLRIKGMYWEARGDFNEAETIYKAILQEQPNNEMAMKRQATLELSRGNTVAGIDMLRKYLDVYANDKDAWEQLGDLYLEMLMYRQALHCYEEVLMFAPTSVAALIRVGDVLYSIGGNSSMRQARSYFARAVDIAQGNCARALCGVLACNAAITDKPALQDARTRAQIELPDLTAIALLRIYENNAPSKAPFVQKMLENNLSRDKDS